mmetsp:Transcript_8897/g.11774  ORF Transcript_8897/g.11774 Transcript_8897/m.11774 type:complete len:432 (-) Transcript_8897:1063-2358(-)
MKRTPKSSNRKEVQIKISSPRHKVEEKSESPKHVQDATIKGLEGMTWPERPGLDGFDEDLDDEELKMENNAFDEFFSVKDPDMPSSRSGSGPSSRKSSRRAYSPSRVHFDGEGPELGGGRSRTRSPGRRRLVSPKRQLSPQEEQVQRQLMLSRQLTRQISRQESFRSDRVKRTRSLGQDTSLSKGYPCCLCGEWMDCGPTVYQFDKGHYALSFMICTDCWHNKTIMNSFQPIPGDNMEWQLDLVLRQKLPTRVQDQIARAKVALDLALADAKLRRDRVRHMQLKVRCFKEFELGTGDFKSWRDGGGFHDYFGEMTQDRPHGRGLKVYSNGSEYFGSFEFGMESGEGQFWWPDGRYFEGSFQNGKAHGKGVMTWRNQQRYEGEFAMGYEHGMGKMTFPDGSNHQGRFRFGVRDGPGVFTRTDGLKEKKNFQR